jgi:hypothetical protein
MDVKIISKFRRPAMRHADDVRARDCDENERWIELLVLAEALPPQAEVWRVAPALPEACCQHRWAD